MTSVFFTKCSAMVKLVSSGLNGTMLKPIYHSICRCSDYLLHHSNTEQLSKTCLTGHSLYHWLICILENTIFGCLIIVPNCTKSLLSLVCYMNLTVFQFLCYVTDLMCICHNFNNGYLFTYLHVVVSTTMTARMYSSKQLPCIQAVFHLS